MKMFYATDLTRPRSGIIVVEETDEEDPFGRPLLIEHHRDTGNGEVVRMVNRDSRGAIASDRYYRLGYPHRDDGPARIEYVNGVVTRETWYRSGAVHRVDGPAEVFHDVPTGTRWWVRGVGCADVARAIEVIERLDSPELRREIDRSRIGPLIRDGYEIPAILTAIDDGMQTVEGIRAVLDGAPLEWARAWESSGAPDPRPTTDTDHISLGDLLDD